MIENGEVTIFDAGSDRFVSQIKASHPSHATLEFVEAISLRAILSA